jgi:hypothetical protein
MQLEAMMTRWQLRGTPRVPVAPGKIRKIITIPERLAERIRLFRFDGHYTHESDAYVALLKAGLEALERPEPPQSRKGARLREGK